MIKRLEQVAAIVVTIGLAGVSYWLFFSWAQGGGVERRQLPNRSNLGRIPPIQQASHATARLNQPLFGRPILQADDVTAYLFDADRQTLLRADRDNAT